MCSTCRVPPLHDRNKPDGSAGATPLGLVQQCKRGLEPRALPQPPSHSGNRCPALVYVFLGRNRSVMEDPSNSIWAATPSARDMEEPSNHHARWILSSKSASPQRSRESEERREYIYRAEELPDWRSTDLCANS
ncbi:uncharacterized protein [Triticum aestivum]|uniref:uncharacterized protein isoform X6 n=1 Tax=Triticum aestivum TaxID=4565 RepID=UPI001D02DF63|nr:uncharacterized protein LOC123052830 isoform X6 [Triticum aestivum]